MTTDNDPVILSAARTPIGRFGGGLSKITAPRLGALAIQAALLRAGLPAGEDQIDEVIMGNVVSAGLGQAPARQATIFAGLDPKIGATTINKVCGSGLKAAVIASQAIRAGDGDLFVTGGFENMSDTPYLVRARGGRLRYGHDQLVDSLLHDGLWDPFEDWSMGMAAEWVANKFEITREAMDQYALGSHQKAIAAEQAGKFDEERIPVPAPRKGKPEFQLVKDEPPRADTSLEKLAALPPVFDPQGRVTAGNAPGLNDGAAAMVIASRKRATELGQKPQARIVGNHGAAVAPQAMFTAPAIAIPKLLDRIGWQLDQVDVLEVNEAFAAQILANGQQLAELGWDWDKVNIHGGAIALGHPLGATGARILTTLLYAMKQHDGQRGIACLCLGGGEAVAMALELE